MKNQKFPLIITAILFSLFLLSFSADDAPILLMEFKTKYLRKEENPEEYLEESIIYDGDGNPIIRKIPIYNESIFLNKWFYNGIYHSTSIGGKKLNTYINLDYSKFSIGQCNENKIYSLLSNYYKPSESSTYYQLDDNKGNDLLNFSSDTSNYEIINNIGVKRGEGLDFYYNNSDESSLCGEFGLNININSDKTNLISQLKTKNYIEKFVWTLTYKTEESGIIVMGNEPHYYDNKTFLMSQYCSVYAILNQSPKTYWSFKFDEIYFFNRDNKKIYLSQNEVDFSVDKGIIIGTDEYKKKIEEAFFYELFHKEICFFKIVKFSDGKKPQDNFFIYYCSKSRFSGKGLDDLEDTYYNKFPPLKLQFKDTNMTFTLDKHDLFIEKFDRIYFLVIFKNSDQENRIWELGEPFFYKTRYSPIIFDEDGKRIGFYNQNLPKISNEEYLKNKNKKEDKNNSNNIILFIGIGVGVIILVALGYFLGKVLNANRKKRANELIDDFEYTTRMPINTNDNNEE